MRQGIAEERRGVHHVDEGVVGHELGRHALEYDHVIGRPSQQERGRPAQKCWRSVGGAKEPAPQYDEKDQIACVRDRASDIGRARSEEHTSALQSLMRISSAVFCLKNKHTTKT